MTPEHDILQVTPRVEALAALCRSNSCIDPALYRKYDVKRGLRDINGQGVLAGLTNISDIISRKEIGGEIVPCGRAVLSRHSHSGSGAGLHP